MRTAINLLAEFHALKQTGLAMVGMDRFKRGLLDLVVDTAFDVFCKKHHFS